LRLAVVSWKYKKLYTSIPYILNYIYRRTIFCSEPPKHRF